MTRGEEKSSETRSSLPALAKGVSRLVSPSSPSPGGSGSWKCGVLTCRGCGGSSRWWEAAEKEGEDAEPACARSVTFCKLPQKERLSPLSPRLPSQEPAVRLVPVIKLQTQEKEPVCRDALRGSRRGYLQANNRIFATQAGLSPAGCAEEGEGICG